VREMDNRSESCEISKERAECDRAKEVVWGMVGQAGTARHDGWRLCERQIV